MHQRKSKNIFIYFFLFLIFGSINNIELTKNQIFSLNKIETSGLDSNEVLELVNQINKLNLNNIFFLKANKIKNIIESNTLIENYKITKIYPSGLHIKITKTNFLAKINQNGKILFLGSNGKLSDINSHNKNLPFIFGNPEIQEFLDLKKIIDESKFSYGQIKNFYFFPSKRWDVELKNKIVLKLPKDYSKNYLDNLFEFLINKNLKNSKIIDARINNQIILND